MTFEEGNNSNILKNKMLLLLGSIIFFMPFFRGLYFQEETYIFTLIIGVISVFALQYIYKKYSGIRLISSIQSISMAYVFLYIVTFIFAYNKYNASFEAIRNISYFMMFLVISYEIKTRNDLSLINSILVLGALVVAIIGLGSGFGSFGYKGAAVDNMISSTFQYHNTFGAYMLAMLFLAMSEISEECKYRNAAMTAIAYVLFVGFIASYSRGAWLLFPLVGLLALILLKGEGFKKIVVSLFIMLLSFGVTFKGITGSINSHSNSGWIWIVVGIVLSSSLAFLINKFTHKIKLNKKAIIAVVLTIGLIITVVIGTGIGSKILPASVSERLSSISSKSFTVVERNVFYKDGLNIVKDNLLLGGGGGTWDAVYNQYKSYDYTTAQAHNFMMQVWTDIGTVGLIVLISLIIAIGITVFRLYKRIENDNIKNKLVSIICAIAVLIGHSIIDFDMSLSAYAFSFWVLLGVVVALKRQYDYVEPKKSKNIVYIPRPILLVLCIVVILVSAGNSIAAVFADKGVKLSQSKNLSKEDLKTLEGDMSSAAMFSPFNAQYRFDTGNVELSMAQNENSQELFQKSIDNIKKAVAINERDYNILANGSAFFFKIAQFDESLALVSKMEKYYPMRDNTYENMINLNFNIAYYYLNKSENDKAVPYLKNVVAVKEKINIINNRLQKEKEELLNGVKDAPKEYVEDRFKIKLAAEIENKITTAGDILKQLNK